jgi:hypothetical protein
MAHFWDAWKMYNLQDFPRGIDWVLIPRQARAESLLLWLLGSAGEPSFFCLPAAGGGFLALLCPGGGGGTGHSRAWQISSTGMLPTSRAVWGSGQGTTSNGQRTARDSAVPKPLRALHCWGAQGRGLGTALAFTHREPAETMPAGNQGSVWDRILQVGTMLALAFVVAFGSSMDVAAIQQDCPNKLDYNQELLTVGEACRCAARKGTWHAWWCS